MKKIIFVFILLLLVPVTRVDGATKCSYSEIAKLKKMAANVNISYDYIEKDSYAQFSITLNNLRDDLYFVDQSNYRQYDYKSEEMTISNYRDGQTIKYVFYATNTDCQEDPLYTARIVLPSYNEFYNDEICVGAEDYSLCQKWSSHNLSYDEFVKKVTEYKNSFINNDVPNDEPTGLLTFIQLIIAFLLDYYIYIIAVLSLGLIAFLAIRKKDDIYI